MVVREGTLVIPQSFAIHHKVLSANKFLIKLLEIFEYVEWVLSEKQFSTQVQVDGFAFIVLLIQREFVVPHMSKKIILAVGLVAQSLTTTELLLRRNVWCSKWDLMVCLWIHRKLCEMFIVLDQTEGNFGGNLSVQWESDPVSVSAWREERLKKKYFSR